MRVGLYRTGQYRRALCPHVLAAGHESTVTDLDDSACRSSGRRCRSGLKTLPIQFIDPRSTLPPAALLECPHCFGTRMSFPHASGLAARVAPMPGDRCGRFDM